MASISLPAPIEARIKNRAAQDVAFSAQIQDDLSLCWAMLDRGLATARKKITRREAKLLLDVQNSTFFDSSQVSIWLHGGLHHQVSDGIALDGMDKKWEIDGPALLAKIAALTDMETIAMLDWCRWMWRNHEAEGLWTEQIDKLQPDGGEE